MGSFERRIEKACQDLEIPGAVIVGGSADGKFKYEKTFGVSSLKTQAPMKLDATMWLASCTKIMTIVATMQCVERGLLKLDEDVTTILPELKEREILKGFEKSGEPILVPNTKPITLRHMLTHQSGIGYDIFRKALNIENAFTHTTVAEANDFPLLFEPGDAWEYSVGVDWAGEMVSRVNNNITLEEYLGQHVWGPLGMQDMTFHPATTPGVLEKLAHMSQRDSPLNMFGGAENPDAKVIHTDNPVWDHMTKHCHGGAGGFGAPFEYAKLLHSLCANDGKVLKPATVDELFKPQLTDSARAVLAGKRTIPLLNNAYGGLPIESRADYALGGMINLDVLPFRNVGTLCWGGYPNLIWFVDREAGLSGIFGTQIIPAGDAKVLELNTAWLTELYKKADVKVKL